MYTKFKFTDARIRALPINPATAKSTELEFSDTEIKGLKCLSGKSGNKRFLLRYIFRSRKISIALGRFPDINVATARKAAQGFRAMLAEGTDPKAEQAEQKQQPTLSEFFWNTYLPYQKKHTRSWLHEIRRFRNHVEPRLGHMFFCDLKASHVLQLQLDLNSAISSKSACSGDL